MLAFELNGLGGRKRQRVDGRAHYVASRMLVEFASVLDQFHQLRLVIEGVQQKDAAGIGQPQAGDDQRGFTLVGFVGLGDLLDGLVALAVALLLYLSVAGQSTMSLGTSSQS